jgi:hypothetical protein
MKRITKISDIVSINRDIEEKERKETNRVNANEYSIFCPLCEKEGPNIIKADLGVDPKDRKIRWVTDCCHSEIVEDKYGNTEPAYDYKPEPPEPPEPRELREFKKEQNKLIDQIDQIDKIDKKDIRAMRIKQINKVSAKIPKTPDKLPKQFDIYKTVRKPIAKPGYVMDDGQGYHRKIKELGDDEGPLSIQELMDEADKLAKIKGHMLCNWKEDINTSGAIATCSCILCDKVVQVIENPTSEEDDISGKAVFEDCGEDETLQSKEVEPTNTNLSGLSDLTGLTSKIKDEFLKKMALQTYIDTDKPCPYCGCPEHSIVNPSMPIVNKCTKCGEMFNPDNINDVKRMLEQRKQRKTTL